MNLHNGPFYSTLKRQLRLILLAGLTLFSAGCQNGVPPEVAAAEEKLSGEIDFNLHVKPILSDKCFACHGPDQNKREAGLRLDLADEAYAALKDDKSRYAIVPGNPARSEVFRRIISQDPEQRMPPVESHLTLSPEEIAVLLKWIRQGAPYKPHWAFIPPAKPEVPQVANPAWVRNPIDAFVLARLQKENLAPAPEASKESLIRRLSFDLTGLPPSIQEIDQFLADASPDAYEKLVDRYLASPAYGERMAANWMDVARFADSHGYLDDKHRPMWRWRDWVISAFNRNLPYNTFLTWQLAGDLLPQATKEQILATGFNRNHRQNSEAGIVAEEFRVEYVADRTHTLGKAFLGLTLECARCHDHKYDPITQKDYYSLFAFFNSTFERGEAPYGGDDIVPGPTLLLSTEDTDQQLAYLQNLIVKQEQALGQLAADLQLKESLPAGPRLEQEVAASLNRKLVAHYPFDSYVPGRGFENKKDPGKPAEAREPELVEGISGKALRINGENNVILGKGVGLYERTDPFAVSLWIKPPKVYDEGAIFYHTDHRRYGNKGYDLLLLDNRLSFRMAHSHPHNAIEVRTQHPVAANEWSHVVISYDGSSRARGVQIFLNGAPAATETVYDHLYKSIVHTPNIHLVSRFLGFRLGYREIDRTFHEGLVDELQIFGESLTELEVQRLYREGTGTASPAKEVPAAQVRTFFVQNKSAGYRAQQQELRRLREREHRLLDTIPEIMVMGDLPVPRTTYVLERGEYDAQGEEVKPGVPASVLPFPEDLPRNRLGLAQWVVSPDNPLTARVVVNRVWEMHFGRGLVPSSDDFGNQGSLPSHPQLLDWLSTTFVAEGWDLKKLHKLLLLSATYRQSSRISTEGLARDPQNTLLARGPKFRLPAEMIRDNALAASGLLVPKIGGPSVYPYQPEGLWEALSEKSWRYNYTQDTGEGLYRRSLYTVWKRTSPPPFMLIFDAPQRSTCTVNRLPTSTPQQALVLLNDPQFVEASRRMGERMLREGGKDPGSRLALGFRLLTSRHPTPEELGLLLELLGQELAVFRQNPAKTQAYLQVGEYRAPPALDQAELAGYGAVANVILNTDEAFSRR
jgi:hypothetical protein